MKKPMLVIVLLAILVSGADAEDRDLLRDPLVATPLGEITLELFHGTHGQVIGYWRAPDGLMTSSGIVEASGFAALTIVSITQASIAARIEVDGGIVVWSATTSHTHSSWVRPTDRNLEAVVLRFECITEGTTGQAEPAAFTTSTTRPGDTVEDGSVVWVARASHELPEGSEAAAIAALRSEGWTHTRPFGRDGIISPDATTAQKVEIGEAVLIILRDKSVMRASTRLIRLRARDTHLQKAARLQGIVDRQVAEAVDLENKIDP